MTYITNRYMKNSFGIVPDIRLGKKMTYKVENKKLTITGYSGIPKIIPLTESTSIEPDTEGSLTKVVRGSLGFGNVKIKNSSGEHLIEGIKNISQFIEALYNEIDTTTPQSKTGQEISANAENFGTSKSDNNLSSYVLSFPALPSKYYYKLREQSTNDSEFLKWYVDEGDIVEKHQIIGEYAVINFKTNSVYGKVMAKASIRTPVAGQILKINRNIDHAEWNIETIGEGVHKSRERKFVNGQDLENHKVQFKIVPSQEEASQYNLEWLQWKGAYDAFYHIKDYAFFASAGISFFRMLKGLQGRPFYDPNYNDYPEYLANRLLEDTVVKIEKNEE